jgi:peptidoglycan/LPS O-acetylase OafA/YrhL
MKMFREDIQVLRAISVLLVLIFHVRQQLLPNGYLGVDIFFFITGFVLFPQLEFLMNSPSRMRFNNLKTFLIRRFNRLIPAFLVSTIISLILLFLFASMSEHRVISMQALTSLFFLGNVAAETLSGNYFSPHPNPFLHYWSLSSEWQLYALIPLTLIIFRKVFKTKWKQFSLFYLVTSFALYILLSNSLLIFDYYSPISRIWEFLLGMLFANVLRRLGESQDGWIKRLFRVIAFCSFILVVSPFELETEIGQVVSGVFFISFVLSKFCLPSLTKEVFLWIGNRSYSIYLYHLPLIFLSLHSPLSAQNFGMRVLGPTCSLVITFVLANWSFKRVEYSQVNKFSSKLTNSSWSVNTVVTFYLVASTFSFSLLLASLLLYGPNNGARVDVAWNKVERCSNDEIPCLISNSRSHKKLLLVGDSHADHFLSVMKDLSIETTVDVYRLAKKIETFGLSRSFQRSVKEIAPDVLIVSQLNMDPNLVDQFEESLNLLKNQNIPLIFLSDNPVFSYDLHYLHHINPSVTSFYLSKEPKAYIRIRDLETNSRLVAEMYLEVAKRLDIEYLDIYKYFCLQDICTKKFNGDFLYYDNNHLSTSGAELVSKDLITIVNRLLSK